MDIALKNMTVEVREQFLIDCKDLSIKRRFIAKKYGVNPRTIETIRKYKSKNSYKRVLQEHIDKILELRLQNYTYASIAKVVDLPTRTVRFEAKKLMLEGKLPNKQIKGNK